MAGLSVRYDLYNGGARTIGAGDLVTTGIVTVSATGIKTGLSILNNGAQFGPDTPGTKSSGLYEAIQSSAAVVEMLAGTFTISEMPATALSVTYLELRGQGEESVIKVASSLSGGAAGQGYVLPFTIDTNLSLQNGLYFHDFVVDVNNVQLGSGSASGGVDYNWNGSNPIQISVFERVAFQNHYPFAGGGNCAIRSVSGASVNRHTIRSCIIDTWNSDGFDFDGPTLVDGCTFRNVNGNPAVGCIGGTDFIVTNNRYEVSSPITGSYLLSVFYTGNNITTRATVEGNTVSGAAAIVGVSDQAGGLTGNTYRVSVSGNTVSSLTAFSAVSGTSTGAIYGSRNPGFNPQGFATTTPAFPASGVDVTNTNPYRVLIYITVTGSSSAMRLTDIDGNLLDLSFGVFAGYNFTLDPGEKVHFNWATNSPDWAWYGL